MSLQINWTKCKGDVQRALPSLTETVALLCPVLAMGDLTEKNIDEWIRRAAVLQAVDGPWLKRGRTNTYLTREHLEPFIGMTTNVASETTRSWNARMREATWRKTLRKAERILEQPDTEVQRK